MRENITNQKNMELKAVTAEQSVTENICSHV